MSTITSRIEALEGVFIEPEDAVTRIVIRVHDARLNATQRDPEREAVGVHANAIEVLRVTGESFTDLCHRAVAVLGPLRRRSVPVVSPVF